jgi:hypothetical protein
VVLCTPLLFYSAFGPIVVNSCNPMQVAAADIAVAESLAEVLTDVLPHIRCWNLEAQTFNTVPDVRLALQSLFSSIIILLVRARLHLKRPKVRRMFKSAFSAELSDTFRAVERSKDILDHWLKQTSYHCKSSCSRAFSTLIANKWTPKNDWPKEYFEQVSFHDTPCMIDLTL